MAEQYLCDICGEFAEALRECLKCRYSYCRRCANTPTKFATKRQVCADCAPEPQKVTDRWLMPL